MNFINHIIFAEDDPEDQLIFKDVLYEINPSLHLEIVSDGLELMQLIKNIEPDLLFLDLDMPNKNGLKCLVEIREDMKLTDLPVVVFSSTTRPANIQTAYEVGAHLFLIKPSVFTDYISAIKSILELNWKDPDKVKEQYCINGRYTAFG